MQSPSPLATSTVWTSLGLLLIVASFSGYVCMYVCMQPLVFFFHPRSSWLAALLWRQCWASRCLLAAWFSRVFEQLSFAQALENHAELESVGHDAWCFIVVVVVMGGLLQSLHDSVTNVVSIVVSMPLVSSGRWAALGFSKEGYMITSTAVVGRLINSGIPTATEFYLKDKNSSQVFPDRTGLNFVTVPESHYDPKNKTIYVAFQVNFAKSAASPNYLLYAYGPLQLDGSLQIHDSHYSFPSTFVSGLILSSIFFLLFFFFFWVLFPPLNFECSCQDNCTPIAWHDNQWSHVEHMVNSWGLFCNVQWFKKLGLAALIWLIQNFECWEQAYKVQFVFCICNDNLVAGIVICMEQEVGSSIL